MVQEVETLPLGWPSPLILLAWPIPWLLMTWRHKEPGHQYQWYWPSSLRIFQFQQQVWPKQRRDLIQCISVGFMSLWHHARYVQSFEWGLLIIQGLYSLSGKTSYCQTSKPRYLMLEWLYHSEILQTSWQHCCRGACQISEQLGESKRESGGSESSWWSCDKMSYRLVNRGPE